MAGFVDTLLDIKNIGDGNYAVSVNYCYPRLNLSLTKEYVVSSTTYASKPDFVAFIQSEVDSLNNGLGVLMEVSAMIGGSVVNPG